MLHRSRPMPKRSFAATLYAVVIVAATTLAADKPKPAAAPVGETVTVDADSVVKYVLSCRKPNGAFGPLDQEYTDAAWNFPAVLTLNVMDAGGALSKPWLVLQNGLGCPRGHGGFSHQYYFYYHVLRGNGRDGPGTPRFNPRHATVSVYHQGFKKEYYASPFGTDGDVLFKSGDPEEFRRLDEQASAFYYHNLSSLYYLVAALRKTDRKVREPQPLIDYILRRQTASGGFLDSGEAGGPDAHITHTWYAVFTLGLLGADVPNPEKIAAFVESCRDKKSGGYRWNPKLSLPGNEPDVFYTRCAAQLLKEVKVAPADVDRTIAWLNSLQNADGGFGDRPGWKSRLFSTYNAVLGMDYFGRLARNDAITTKQLPVPKFEPIPAGEFQVFQASFKVPKLNPDELAGLSKRGLNLLGIKSYDFADVEKLLPAIESQKLPMDVVLCPEMYPHRLTQLGATLNHVGNFTLDARWTAEDRAIWQTADAAGRDRAPWASYRDKVIAPIRKLGGFVWPEQDFEMEYAYLSYDSARDGKGGYNAVLCGFNWPPKDFVRVFPWHERYTDRLTTIADVDAHGDLTKWSAQMDTVRTLFVAKGPTYADFQEAAAAGRVVTVIAQPEGVASGASYYGPAAAVEFVKQRRAEWQWWN